MQKEPLYLRMQFFFHSGDNRVYHHTLMPEWKSKYPYQASLSTMGLYGNGQNHKRDLLVHFFRRIHKYKCCCQRCMTAKVNFATGSKPSEMIFHAFLYCKSCLSKIVFVCHIYHGFSGNQLSVMHTKKIPAPILIILQQHSARACRNRSYAFFASGVDSGSTKCRQV